jgi:FtsP/CotA-like multicopper oxidase with cupredoxin domain
VPLRNVTNFRLSSAERAEVVIDFADPQFDGVIIVYFENRLQQDDGRRPDELGQGTLILQFRLGEKVPHPSRIYDILPVEPTERRKHTIPRAELVGARRRTFEFDRRHGAWAINGKLFDTCDKPLARIPLNATERWHLVNKSGGWAYPIHPHLELMHVQRRNGKLPPPEERDGNALKDTIYLGPNDEVEMAMRFRDFTGPLSFTAAIRSTRTRS